MAAGLQADGRPCAGVAVLARVWQRSGASVFEERDVPLRSFAVEMLGEGGARLALPCGERRVLLDFADADAFQAFVAGCAREAPTDAKRFFDGAFTMRVEPGGLPAARGKRMVSFVREGARILHAWCDEGIVQTVWKPVELRQALLMVMDELVRLRPP